MQTVEDILEKLGGYAKVAERTKTPATTVHSWQRSNFIPNWRRPAILSLAKKARVPLSDSDFPQRPAKQDAVA